MGCGCNKEKPKGGGKSFTKAVVEIVNPEKITLLRKVVIPASLGDETTIPPAVGLYRNVVLCYEASKRVYLYSSDGIPTFISTDLDAIEDELERLGIAIEDETIAREQADEELREDISGLSEALAEETLARISGDDQINDTVSAHTLQISELSTGLNDEIDNRRNADTDLQSQIDAISASSDVKDIVGTHAELENYDTTHLGDNDIIKVLQDETQDGATTYYRWSTATQEFTLIGEEGPYYTKSQTDGLLTGKQNVLTAGNNITITGDTISATDTTYSAGNGLLLNGTTFSADTTILQPRLTAGDNVSISNNTISATDTKYTAGSGLDLTGTEFSIDNTVALKTDLPTVNNAIFTVQKNGADVASFTANSAVDVTANITVPTDTAQLTNTAGYQTASDVASAISGKQDTLTPGNNIQINGNTISATNTTYSAGNGLDLTGTVFSADTDILQTKLTPGTNITIQDGVISSAGGTYTAGNGLELTNNEFSIDDSIVALKSDIPIISSASLTIQRNGTDVATFTTDSPNPVTANILVPTNNAQLINGAGYQTASDVQSLISGKQDTLTPGNNIQISGNTISATDTKYSAGNGLNLTGTVFTADTDILATKSYVDSVVPEDMVVLSYGNSTWNDFITAYNDNRVVYCRASSNANPSTGSQTRLAFMAYVNNGTNPTNVEFQYYRSVSSHSASQQGDQVYVYKLESNGTWTVTVRNAFSKVVAGNNMTSSYSNGAITLNATVPTDVSELNNDAGYLTNTNYATDTTGGVVKVGSGLQITNGVLSATGGGVADAVEWANVLNRPTDVSYWNNDAGYLTSVSWNDVLDKPTFATVATSGSYNDLSNKPTIPAAQVSSDWNATSGVAQVLNKPTKLSQFTNDSGFITSYTETDPVFSASPAAGITSSDITSWDNKSDFSGDYNDLTNKPTIPAAQVNSDWNATSGVARILNKPTIPTATSDLTNDSGFITNTVNNLVNYTPTTGLAEVATSGSYNDLSNKPTIPAAQINSDWNASSGVAQILNKPTLATVATSGSYNDLSNKPTIPTVPTNVSAFTNDAGYQNSTQVQSAINSAISEITGFEYQVVQTLPATGEKGVIYLVPNSGSAPNIYDEYIWIESGQSGSFEKIGTTETDLSGYVTDGELQTALADYTTTEDLAAVATSGSYNDLSNKPTIPAAQVNSDWNASSGVARILNKPTLATVATSGSYDDLSDKPTIPTVNNATLTIQKNGTTVKTFTANASSNVTANITVPTATSDLTNDSGFITGVAWGEVTGKPTFATVATTGSYNDLEDKPTIPAAQVNADWNASSGVAQILNKPTIPTVPTAGTTASAVSTTASGGSASTWSKSDHVHSISSSTITSALGYTPYNSTNPNGYTSNAGTITGVSANGTSVATSGTANIPSATTGRYGVTQLSTSTSSTSTTLAATPSAVKAAYDLANGKQDHLTAGTGIDITNNVISATAVANTFASYQNGTLYITNSAQNADTENF